jgi:hypothetical protein
MSIIQLANSFSADPHNTPLLRCFGRLKARGKRNAPARSLAMTNDLAQVGTIPGLIGGSAYKGSPCYKRTAGLHKPIEPGMST